MGKNARKRPGGRKVKCQPWGVAAWSQPPLALMPAPAASVGLMVGPDFVGAWVSPTRIRTGEWGLGVGGGGVAPVGRGCVHACVQVCTRPAGLHNPSSLSSQWTRGGLRRKLHFRPAAPPLQAAKSFPGHWVPETRAPKASAPALGQRPSGEFQAPGRTQPSVGSCLPRILSPGSSPTSEEGHGFPYPRVRVLDSWD